MEDISRELEREIARSKPKPYKQDRKTRILIIDDFGKMKSGEYLKTFVKILFFTSVVCFVSAVLFYYLYTGLSKDARLTKAKLILAEKQVDELTSKKEILMTFFELDFSSLSFPPKSISNWPNSNSNSLNTGKGSK